MTLSVVCVTVRREQVPLIRTLTRTLIGTLKIRLRDFFMQRQYHITDNFIARKLPVLLGDKSERSFRNSKLTGFLVRGRRLADSSIAIAYFAGWYTDNGRKWNKISVGDGAKYTADEAREEARRKLQAVAAGDDPKAVRARKQALPLFEDLLADFREEHLSEKEPATVKDYEGRIRRILLPSFTGMRVADIAPAMVDALRRKHRRNKTDLNRALAVGSKMMALAIRKGWRADNPFKGIQRFTEKAREHWLDEHDLPPFLDALGDINTPVGELIRFLAVSGWRVSKARLLRWDQVDLKRLTVNLGDTATKKSATVLSADAAALIDRQAGRLGYVFSNTRGRQPVDYRMILSTLRSICEQAQIRPITPHVLRHTAASWAAINGASAHELRQGFGWKTLSMTNRYVGLSESLARAGAEKAASAINVLGKPKAEVFHKM